MEKSQIAFGRFQDYDKDKVSEVAKHLAQYRVEDLADFKMIGVYTSDSDPVFRDIVQKYPDLEWIDPMSIEGVYVADSTDTFYPLITFKPEAIDHEFAHHLCWKIYGKDGKWDEKIPWADQMIGAGEGVKFVMNGEEGQSSQPSPLALKLSALLGTQSSYGDSIPNGAEMWADAFAFMVNNPEHVARIEDPELKQVFDQIKKDSGYVE